MLKQEGISAEQVRALRNRFESLLRLYSRCYNLPGIIGKIAEKILDIATLLATNQTVLRSLARTFRIRSKRSKKDAGPVYVLEDGEVKVWGVD